MRQSALTLSALVLIFLASTTTAIAQVRQYTKSFEADRQADQTIVESLQTLKDSHSKLASEPLLQKLNEWGKPHSATFRTEKGVIVMKAFWVHEGVESKPHGWRETNATSHLFGIANQVMTEWNNDRSFRLQRFAGVELKALNEDRTETKNVNGKRSWKLVASPECVILLE